MPDSKFTPAQTEELASAFAARRILAGGAIMVAGGRCSVASLDDIIASKRATGREKDVADVRRLEKFRTEYMRRQQ